jgi:predicted Zn-dependent protease with MMP-like domain
LLDIESWIVDGEFERARASLRNLREQVGDDPEFEYLEGVAAWREGNDDEAILKFEAALTADPDHSDACHGLFMLFETLGDHERSVSYALRVRAMDEEEERDDTAMLQARGAEIHAIATRVLTALPDEFCSRLENVPVVLETRPSRALVATGFDPRALGLFEGLADSDAHNAGPIPSRIVLYTHNLAAEFSEKDELAAQVEITLLHEVGHFFGLDEEQVEALGLG